MGAEAVAGDLAGLRVLVTRPVHQARGLCERIEKLGGRSLCLPVLEIADPSDLRPALAIIDHLDRFNIAVFISANAVERAHALITRRRTAWPGELRLAAIGKRTAAALSRLGLQADICPGRGADSAALLAMKEMQAVNGMRIVIFRGEGGREALADGLRERGARVEYAEVYRRARPDVDLSAVQAAGQGAAIDLITLTSNEGLRNLYDMIGLAGREWLLRTPLVVIGQRTSSLARELGFIHEPVIARAASDAGLVQAIKEWYADKYWEK